MQSTLTPTPVIVENTPEGEPLVEREAIWDLQSVEINPTDALGGGNNIVGTGGDPNANWYVDAYEMVGSAVDIIEVDSNRVSIEAGMLGSGYVAKSTQSFEIQITDDAPDTFVITSFIGAKWPIASWTYSRR